MWGRIRILTLFIPDYIRNFGIFITFKHNNYDHTNYLIDSNLFAFLNNYLLQSFAAVQFFLLIFTNSSPLLSAEIATAQNHSTSKRGIYIKNQHVQSKTFSGGAIRQDDMHVFGIFVVWDG